MLFQVTWAVGNCYIYEQSVSVNDMNGCFVDEPTLWPVCEDTFDWRLQLVSLEVTNAKISFGWSYVAICAVSFSCKAVEKTTR